MNRLRALLDTDAPLALLDTDTPDEALNELRRMALREGRSIYCWNPDQGLYPIGDPSDVIAGSRTLATALQILDRQPYHSTCVISGLDGVDFALLQQHSWKGRLQSGAGFKLLLLVPERLVPEGLRRKLHMETGTPRPVRLRLRKGKWLI